MKGGTELGRVRGLGSARHGAQHWLQQRVSAVGNILLFLWLIASLLLLPAYDHGTVSAWLAQPIVAVPMIILLVNIAWHVRLGWQILIEDYIHDAGTSFGLRFLLNVYTVAIAALGMFAVARLAFTGAAA